jgi:hypothetical protein
MVIQGIRSAQQPLIRKLPAANLPDQDVGPAFGRQILAVPRKSHRAVVNDATEPAEGSELLFRVRVRDIDSLPAGRGHEAAVG